MKNFLLILTFAFLIVACNSKKIASIKGEQFTTNAEIRKGKIVVSKDTLSDPFQLKKAYLKGDTLFVSLQHGGGCGTNAFQLNVNEINKKKVELRLIFENDDNCKALLFKQYYFVLSDYHGRDITMVKNGKNIF
ncbi:MAG: hypothetical protein ACO3E1_02355 [Flavobacteriales bacterium]